VEFKDWLWLLFLYGSGIVGRFTMIACAYPFLNLAARSKATRVTWRECVVMTWGGLRGAVGLALALSMRSQLYGCGKNRTGDLMVFHVGGFAGLTLLINATTCGTLLTKLEMTKPPNVRKKLLATLQKEMLTMAISVAKTLKKIDRRFAGVEIAEVEGILRHQEHHDHDQLNLHGHLEIARRRGSESQREAEQRDEDEVHEEMAVMESMDSVNDQIHQSIPKVKKIDTAASLLHWWWGFEPIPRAKLQQDVTRCTTNGGALDDEDLAMERHFYLSMLRAQYAKQLREDMIPQYAAGAIDLPYSIDRAGDLADEQLQDWLCLKKLMLCRADSRLLDIARYTLASPYSMYSPTLTVDGHEEFDLFSVVVFMDAHHLVCQRVMTEKGLIGGSTRVAVARAAIIVEAGKEVEEAHQFLQDNKVGKDEISIVRTKQLLAACFGNQIKRVGKWMERGIINAGEAEELMLPVHHSIKEVKKMQKHIAKKMGIKRAETIALAAMKEDDEEYEDDDEEFEMMAGPPQMKVATESNGHSSPPTLMGQSRVQIQTGETEMGSPAPPSTKKENQKIGFMSAEQDMETE